MPDINDRIMLNHFGYIDRRDQSTLVPEDRLRPLLGGGNRLNQPDLSEDPAEAGKPGATPQKHCGRPPCFEHGSLCAFHGDEPDRCPWCHRTWTRISIGDSHSCERRSAWKDGKRADAREYPARKVAEAVAMRKEAAQRPQEGWQSTFCSHWGTGTLAISQAVATRLRAIA